VIGAFTNLKHQTAVTVALRCRAEYTAVGCLAGTMPQSVIATSERALLPTPTSPAASVKVQFQGRPVAR